MDVRTGHWPERISHHLPRSVVDGAMLRALISRPCERRAAWAVQQAMLLHGSPVLGAGSQGSSGSGQQSVDFGEAHGMHGTNHWAREEHASASSSASATRTPSSPRVLTAASVYRPVVALSLDALVSNP